jgi:acetylserotonin N-methyltransferase
LPKNGRIIIHEVLFNNNKAGPFSAAALNLSMLLWTQGQQLSQHEIIRILKKGGFREIVIIPTNFGDWSIVTGIK